MFPPRVHVIFARDADYAIVLRRGPSKSMCTIGWDLKNDQFKLGQWLRGVIDYQVSDLSPDGKHFLYLAKNGITRGKVSNSWTAISRAPYLKAIALWTSPFMWGGGGMFLTNTDYLLCYPDDFETELQPAVGFQELSGNPFTAKKYAKCATLYSNRLVRDGWTFFRKAEEGSSDEFSVFRKQLPLGWFLEKTLHATLHQLEGKSYYYESHQLTHPGKGVTLDYPDWDWAELDRDRLVWTERGILRAATLMKDGPDFMKVLYDFNDLVFKPIQAPY